MVHEVLSFDVGGTDIKYAKVTKDGAVEGFNKVKTPYEREQFYQVICDVIEKEAKEIEFVSFSFPGFIDSVNGILVMAGALLFMEDEHFTREVEKRTNKKAFVFNDAKSAAISEMVNGNAVGIDDYFCVTIGTGIGGAIVSNGQLINGHNFTAGEIGIMAPTYESKRMWNDECGMIHLRDEYAKKNNLEFESVSGQMALSDVEIKEKFMNILSTQIMNLIYVLNPRKVLIGGAISSDQKFIDELREAVKERNIVPKLDFQLEACKNENKAGLIGAAHLAFDAANK